MIEVNFYLRDKNAEKQTAIILFLSFGGGRIKIGVVEQINPIYWDFDLQLCKQSKDYPKGVLINEGLSKTKQLCYATFREYLNESQQKLPNHKAFKELVQSKLKPSNNSKKREQSISLYEFIEEFIKESKSRFNDKTGKPIAHETIKNYELSFSVIKGFGKFNRKSVQFEDIDLEFYNRFKDYLVYELQYANNTVGKHIKSLKTFLNEATERGFNTNLQFKSKKFKVLTEEVDKVYVNENELKIMFELDLSSSKQLERVRDLFLIGCYTGLRFSDFRLLAKENFIEDQGKRYIEILTQKTRQRVVIPVHPIVEIIRERYKHISETSLPKALSNEHMNFYLKQIGKLAGFNQIEKVSITKAGRIQTQLLPKYQLVTTHTARRSFATNMYLMGIPTITIMAITGHKTEKAFMKYLKVSPREHANILHELWSSYSKI